MAQTVSIGEINIYTIVVNATLIFLFLSFTVPIALGILCLGTDGRRGALGHQHSSVSVFAVLSIFLGLTIVAVATNGGFGSSWSS